MENVEYFDSRAFMKDKDLFTELIHIIFIYTARIMELIFLSLNTMGFPRVKSHRWSMILTAWNFLSLL